MNKQEILIEKFINKLNSKFKDLNASYSYNFNQEEFIISHINPKYDVDNIKFMEYFSNKVVEDLYDNNVFNFSFNFDYEKFKEAK